MSDLTTWVSDQLHGILGYSQSHLADFVVSLAKQERSAQGLLAKLAEADVPDTAATRKFAAELFSRAPRGGGSSATGLSASERQRREAVSLLKQNEKYGMVSDGDDEEDEVTAAVQRALQEKERERKRLEKEEAKRQKKRSRAEEQAVATASSSADPAAEAERQRDEDARERDEFAERLRQKDLAKTRTLNSKEASETAQREEEKRRLVEAQTADEKAEMLAELRKVALGVGRWARWAGVDGMGEGGGAVVRWCGGAVVL